MNDASLIVLDRKEHRVVVTINCVDVYEAMLLYDKIAASLTQGSLTIDILQGDRQ